jgi:hypothetical protein
MTPGGQPGFDKVPIERDDHPILALSDSKDISVSQLAETAPQ